MTNKQNYTSSTRLHGNFLLLARLAWVILFFYVIWKVFLGGPLYYERLKIICTGTAQECSQTLSPTVKNAQELQNMGLSVLLYANFRTGLEAFQTLIWIGMGVLIFLLRSDDWMALLVSAMMITFPSGSETYPIGQVYPQLRLISETGFRLQNAILFLVFGLFPNGRFAPRWMRWYWWGMVFLSLVGDPLLARFVPQIASFLWGPAWLSFLTLGPYSQIYRYYKVSHPIERQQTKWVVFGFTIFAFFVLVFISLVLVGIFPGILSGVIFGAFGILIPLGFGMGVLRYRLWDIDVIIRKTLVYGVLTVILGVIFFGGVTLLQSLFVAISHQQSAISVVISTLIIAALFNPLRQRLQNVIDKRFYRRKYDAQQVLGKFALVSRNETNIDVLVSELVFVIQETVQSDGLSIWLKPVKGRDND